MVGLTIFFISLLAFGDTDRSMLWFEILFICGSAFMAYRYFKKANATNEEEVIHAPPPNATNPQLIRFHKRVLVLCLIIFPLLTLLVIYDLNSLLAGNEQSNELWDYVSLLYQKLGYWPTVLSAPAIGLACVLINLRKINVLKSKY
jgi:hypothetical protein